MTEKNTGFISLHRKILDWGWYTDANTKSLFLHLVLRANWKENTWLGKVIERGSFVTSRDSLAKETGLSVQQVRTALKKLESTKEITITTSSRNTLITVVNYEQYQDTNQDDNQQITNEQPTDNQQVTTNNKGNNNNKDNKYIYAGKIIKLVERDFNNWQKNYQHIPDLVAELQGLDDYYFSKGITKDWYMRCSAALASKNAKYKEATVKPIDKAHEAGIFMG
jgi:hypothetical protein